MLHFAQYFFGFVAFLAATLLGAKSFTARQRRRYPVLRRLDGKQVHLLALVLVSGAISYSLATLRPEAPMGSYEDLAKRHGVTEAALENFFRLIGEEAVPPAELDSRLRAFAGRYRELEQRLGRWNPGSPEAERRKESGLAALARGDLNKVESLLVVPEAARDSKFGLRISPKGIRAPSWWLERDFDRAESGVLVGLYVKLDHLHVRGQSHFVIYEGLDSKGVKLFQILTRREAQGGSVVHARVRVQAGGWQRTSDVPVPEGWQKVQLEWWVPEGGTPALGCLRLSVETGASSDLVRFDPPGELLTAVRVGAAGGQAASINGYLDVDDFSVRRRDGEEICASRTPN